MYNIVEIVTLTAVGMVEVDVQYGEQQATLNLVIVDGKGPPLLGRDWLAVTRLGAVPQG